MLKVKYIGESPSGKRLLCGKTLVTWTEPGDVQEVPEAGRSAIEGNPHVWEIVGRSSSPEPAEITVETEEEPSLDPPLVDLNAMDKAQLQTYCQREFGEQVDKRWSESKIRQYITSQIGRRR
jgi:hypothetical protein